MDACSQSINYLRSMNELKAISNQRLCTSASQGGCRKYHQGLYPCDGLLDYPSRHSL